MMKHILYYKGDCHENHGINNKRSSGIFEGTC